MNFDFAIDKLKGDVIIQPDGTLALVTNSDEIVQRVKVRLRWFLGEWFLDTSAGVPWMQQILGSRNFQLASMLLRRQIIDTEGIGSINTLNVRFDATTRKLQMFAVVTIGNQQIQITEGVSIG